MWCIYKHTNKINNKSYIGKTTNPKHRWENNGSKYQTCPYFWNAIKKYGWDGFEHSILEDNLTQEQADSKEKEYIQIYNTLSPNGYNLASGGTGGNVWISKSEEEKARYAEQQRLETLSRGLEWHQKLSQSQLKNWNDNQSRREKLSQRMKGRGNPSAKRCLCVETGKIYDSYADAAEDCGRARSSGPHIGEVIKGKLTTFAGYHWKEIKE